jgi:hypothetical protein
VFTVLGGLRGARLSQRALRSGGTTIVLPQDNPQLFAYRREYPGAETFLAVVNFSDAPQAVGLDLLKAAGSASRSMFTRRCARRRLDEDCERCGSAPAGRVSLAGPSVGRRNRDSVIIRCDPGVAVSGVLRQVGRGQPDENLDQCPQRLAGRR